MNYTLLRTLPILMGLILSNTLNEIQSKPYFANSKIIHCASITLTNSVSG